MAHDRLGEVLRILRVVLEKHHTLQNTELLMAAGALIQQVKGKFNSKIKKIPIPMILILS